jgi:single-strand DNA-binding protein
MSHAAAITLVGRAGTDPQLSSGPTGDRVSLRVVATERRLDRTTQEWVDGDEFGVSVVCWKGLAKAVLGTVRKGDPLVVCGRIATRRFERDGVTQYFTEIKADTVGLDVAKVGGRITRRSPDAWGSAAPVTTDPSVDSTPVDAAPASQADVGLPSEPDYDDDPWGLAEEESADRSGELVASG